MIKKKEKNKEIEIPKIADGEEQLTLEKEKFEMKKEYYQIGVAVIILLILVGFLVKELIVTKKYEVIVPDEPDYKEVNVGVIDMSEKNSTDQDINSGTAKELKVNYEIVSDYYKKGIVLSNTQVDYVKDNFVITSGPLSEDSFVSTITLDGKLNWIYKVEEKDYKNFAIYKTVEADDAYYAVGIATTKNDKKSLAILSLNKNGSKKSFRIMKEEFDTKVLDVLVNGKKIAIVTGGYEDLSIYYTDSSLNDNSTVYESKKNHSGVSLYYEYGTYLDEYINIVASENNKTYELKVNIKENNSTITELTSLNSDTSTKVGSYQGGYIGYTNQKLYKLNAINDLENTYDYSKIQLETEEDVKKYLDTSEDMMGFDINDNQIAVLGIADSNGQTIVTAQTSFSTLYDVFDSKFKLKKRYVINNLKYFVEDGIKIKSFYIDGKIYEVYSYGTKTPSIMISKIG